MMLPILNTNDAELAICVAEGWILPLDGTMMTPWIARKATFVASITVDYRILFRASKGTRLDVGGGKTPHISNQDAPFGNQLLHKLLPNFFDD
jgi:hypothetical protein